MKKILLFSLALFSVVLTSNAQCACSNKTKAETSVQVTGNGVAYFKAAQIRCGGCANKVIKTLRADKGVKDVAVNVETKDVAIAFDKTLTSKEQIIKDFKTIEYIVKEVYSE